MAHSRASIALCFSGMSSPGSHRQQGQETGQEADRRWGQSVTGKYFAAYWKTILKYARLTLLICAQSRNKSSATACSAIHWRRSWICRKTNFHTNRCHGFKSHYPNRYEAVNFIFVAHSTTMNLHIFPGSAIEWQTNRRYFPCFGRCGRGEFLESTPRSLGSSWT